MTAAMTSAPRLSIVVVTYRRGETLELCLDEREPRCAIDFRKTAGLAGARRPFHLKCGARDGLHIEVAFDRERIHRFSARLRHRLSTV